MFSEVIKLIKTVTKTDDEGFEISEETKTEVFANRKSIKMTEFYESQKLGYKLACTFEVRVDDYNKEKLVEYEEEKYKIERTYQKDAEIVELVCSKVGD